MERVLDRCAGLEVHKKAVTACVRVPDTSGGRTQHVRTAATTAAELLMLRDWLEAHRVSHVAMESTGVYWRPVFYVLEDACTCVLANASQVAQVPGRKTDVNDAVWIAQLLEHGLIQPSFVPPAPIRELRDLTQYRKLFRRFRAHHAFLVSQLLAHLDYLAEAGDTVSAQIDTAMAPFHEALARLDTIHGVTKRTAEALIAALGVAPSRHSNVRASGSPSNPRPEREVNPPEDFLSKTRSQSSPVEPEGFPCHSARVSPRWARKGPRRPAEGISTCCGPARGLVLRRRASRTLPAGIPATREGRPIHLRSERQGVALLRKPPHVISEEATERPAAGIEVEDGISNGRWKRGVDGHDLRPPLHVRQHGQHGGLRSPTEGQPPGLDQYAAARQWHRESFPPAALSVDEDSLPLEQHPPRPVETPHPRLLGPGEEQVLAPGLVALPDRP
jgi:transposase